MKPLAVYIHIPFCVVKCGYCDFNTYTGLDSLKGGYAAAVCLELGTWGAHVQGRVVSSVAFGGGTPGEFPAESIATILNTLNERFAVAADAEVSFEANPGTTDNASFEALKCAGVTRLSLGAQSFNADELRFLDRIHSAEAIGGSVRLARRAGFENINLDLMYGLPGQSNARWLSNVDMAVALDPEHLSLYALTVEPGTPLAARVDRGEVTMPSSDDVAEMYEAASDRLETAGFEQYEVSNWARPGRRSLHNQVYWTGGDYLGIGAGAHGFVDGVRFENLAHPRSYIERVRQSGLAIAASYRPEGAMARSDWLTARLRLLDGFDAKDFEAEFGESLDLAAGPPLHEAAAAGLLSLEPRVRVTAAGRLLHGEICARVLAHLEGIESQRNAVS